MRRHLRETLDMTPKDYRTKWGLSDDAPLVSEAYIERRSAVRAMKDQG